jgi:hypothetical protein
VKNTTSRLSGAAMSPKTCLWAFMGLLAYTAPVNAGERLDLRTPSLVFETTWQVLNVIDAGQTVHIARSQRCGVNAAYREVNPLTRGLIGERPKERDVLLSSAAYALGHYYVSRWLKARTERAFSEGSPNRGAWLFATGAWHVGMLAGKLDTVASNHKLGLRPWGDACYPGY